MSWYDDSFFAPQGWQCPVCKRVYSPSMTVCLYCGPAKTETITNTAKPVYHPLTHDERILAFRDYLNSELNHEADHK